MSPESRSLGPFAPSRRPTRSVGFRPATIGLRHAPAVSLLRWRYPWLQSLSRRHPSHWGGRERTAPHRPADREESDERRPQSTRKTIPHHSPQAPPPPPPTNH